MTNVIACARGRRNAEIPRRETRNVTFVIVCEDKERNQPLSLYDFPHNHVCHGAEDRP